MNFLGFFVLLAAILVVFTQQSDAGAITDAFRSVLDAIKNELNIGNRNERDTVNVIIESFNQNQKALVYANATVDLKEQYINATKLLANAEDIILDGIKKIKNLLLENPEAAQKLSQQVFEKARNALFESGIPIIKAIGVALELSNDAAQPGLNVAIQLIQRAGFATLDAINLAENLFNQGLAAGKEAARILLKAVKKSVKAGFAGSYNNIKLSIQLSVKALRDAQSRPLIGQVKNVNCEAAAAAVNDPEILEAINDINITANKALARGADPVLVQIVRQNVICQFVALTNITDESRKTVDRTNVTAVTDSRSIKITLNIQQESAYDGIHDIAANTYFLVAKVAVKSGNQSNNLIEEAIIALEQAKAEFVLAIRVVTQLIVDGLRYGGDTLKLAKEAAIDSLHYGKLSYIQGLNASAKILLNLL